MTRLQDWLQLLRVSNAPTCVTNVLVGCAIGIASLGPDHPGPWIDPGAVLIVLAGVFGFYFGGMALNDVIDAKHDKKTGAPRPIALGRIARGKAGVLALLLLGVGIIGCSLAGGIHGLVAGLVLLTCIVLYDLLHRAAWPAILLMGCCRGLVYVIAAFAVTPAPDAGLLIAFGLGLGFHTMLVTSIARKEWSGSRPAAWHSLLLPLAPCGALLAVGAVEPWAVILFGVILALWLGRMNRLLLESPPRVVNAVLAGLSGIALLDAFYLAMLGWAVLAFLALACFALTSLAHRSISGT
ncbi:MAG: hypothetical protein CMJ36_05585 [Phycisphaerae bacterium]|nr:hypothetical protein [Phycisphaerae bacterium]